MKDKRFIEEAFPIKEVSIAGAREKNIRHGHISTLHIWWARRPLATSRATIYASLTPEPKTEEEKREKNNFIAELSKWENSNNEELLEKARQDILKANGGKPPKVLDPFGGGGSIPLEALRLGCETYSMDYNPVAVLIQKCTLEFPQKYGEKISKEQYLSERPWLINNKDDSKGLFDDKVNPLAEDVKYWGNWILEEAKKDLSQFYPQDPDGSIPVAYIWARTIPCQNPSCGAEIPLMRQFWLANKKNKKVALHPVIEGNNVNFEIAGDGYKNSIPEDFDPSEGTISRATATCPVCGSVVEAKNTRKLFQEGKNSERMVTVVTHKKGVSGKKYRLPTKDDIKVFSEAKKHLNKKSEKLKMEWGMNPVPDEELPLMSGVFNAPIYGYNEWGKLFNSRQLFSLITIIQKIKQFLNENSEYFSDSNYFNAVLSYLSLSLDMSAAFVNSFARWENTSELVKQIYSRQALPMLWDYSEANPISGSSGSFENGYTYYLEVIKHLSFSSQNVNITQSSSNNLKFDDHYFDAVFTDPPYYNSVPYADLSDFFYVWLKRSLSDVYPELFSTPLSPKKNEICEMAGWDSKRYANKDKQFFENNLKKSFQEIQRVLKENAIVNIVYAHKSTEGWETVINALLESGLVVTGSWPLNTEMKNRLRASDSAALASSIYIVARKYEQKETGFYNEVKEKLNQYLHYKLDELWNQGVVGTDFFIAAIGSAIEVFGKYNVVMDYEGNVKRADVLLDDVREIVMNYAVRQVMENGFAGEVSELTRFYVFWRFSFGEAKVPFDDANKLARSIGIDLATEWGDKGYIKKEKSTIRLLGPQDRKIENIKTNKELIDVLHKTLLLWEIGKKDEILDLLSETGLGQSEAFYRVAQSVSESLRKVGLDSKEKKLIDGFLGGKERMKESVKNKTDKGQQRKLKF